MDKIKEAFENLPHVQTLFVNDNNDYCLAKRPGFEKGIDRSEYLGHKPDAKPVDKKQTNKKQNISDGTE